MYDDYYSNQNNENNDSIYQGGYTSYRVSEPEPVLPEPPKKKTFVRKTAGLLVSALVFGSVAGAAFQGVNYLSGNYLLKNEVAASQEVKSADTAKTVSTKSEGTQTITTDVTEVVKAAMPSVVSITSVSQQKINSFFYGEQIAESEGSGSGIIVGQNDEELLIVTNNHVVEGASALSVVFIDGKSVSAQVKGTNADMDLAVIAVSLSEIESGTMSEISVAVLGDSAALQVGESVIAIGNALGYGQSVTTGVVSALNRKVTVENTTNELIQTDAAINPGNSGGALLNTQGQLIGINAVKFASSDGEIEGMGYAIPISSAKPIIDELMNRQTRSKVEEGESGYLGIYGATVDSEVHQLYDMPYGVYVSGLVEGGAAETAGITKGDIITKFDGNTIQSMNDLQDLLQYYKAGETVEIIAQYQQNGEYIEKTINLTLAKNVQLPSLEAKERQ